jgi:site-specific recombinase XerD
LIHAGMTLKQTQKLIGHLTAKMTERYSHLEEAQNLDWLQRLDVQYEQGGNQPRL